MISPILWLAQYYAQVCYRKRKCPILFKTQVKEIKIPLPWFIVRNVTTVVSLATLLQVITWATYHKDDPPPPEDDENKEKRTDDISSWDADFLKVDQGTLFELILAANYLDIKVPTLSSYFCFNVVALLCSV